MPPAFSSPLCLGSVPTNLLQKNIFIFYDSQIRRIILRPREFHGQGRCPKPPAAILYFPVARPSESWGVLHIPAKRFNSGHAAKAVSVPIRISAPHLPARSRLVVRFGSCRKRERADSTEFGKSVLHVFSFFMAALVPLDFLRNPEDTRRSLPEPPVAAA